MLFYSTPKVVVCPIIIIIILIVVYLLSTKFIFCKMYMTVIFIYGSSISSTHVHYVICEGIFLKQNYIYELKECKFDNNALRNTIVNMCLFGCCNFDNYSLRCNYYSLMRNPVTTKKHYRLYVIHKLPNVRLIDFQKVKLKVWYIFLCTHDKWSLTFLIAKQCVV